MTALTPEETETILTLILDKMGWRIERDTAGDLWIKPEKKDEV